MGGLFLLRLFWRPEVGCCLANTNLLRIFHELKKNPCPLKLPKLCQRHLRIVCKKMEAVGHLQKHQNLNREQVSVERIKPQVSYEMVFELAEVCFTVSI